MLISMDLTLPREAGFVRVMRDLAGDVLTQLRASEPDIADIRLAVTEACANAVRHATGTHKYRIHLEVEEYSCSVEVIDVGPGFGDLVAAADGQPADPEDESGRGVQLMRALVDDLRFIRQGDSNSVKLVKRWEPVDSD